MGPGKEPLGWRARLAGKRPTVADDPATASSTWHAAGAALQRPAPSRRRQAARPRWAPHRGAALTAVHAEHRNGPDAALGLPGRQGVAEVPLVEVHLAIQQAVPLEYIRHLVLRHPQVLHFVPVVFVLGGGVGRQALRQGGERTHQGVAAAPGVAAVGGGAG